MVVRRISFELDQDDRLIGYKEIILIMCLIVTTLIYTLLATNGVLIFDNIGDTIAIGIMSVTPISVVIYAIIMMLLGE